MVDFSVIAGGFPFTLEIGTERRLVQRPIEALIENL